MANANHNSLTASTTGRSPAKRWACMALVAVAVALPSVGRAESWIFDPTAPLVAPAPITPPVERRPARGPFATRPQGEYIQSGLRIRRDIINIQGRVFEQNNTFETYYQRSASF